jgi:hypothetical protein
MTGIPESPYRTARRAFIAACGAAGVDVIARVHPTARAADGKPLFLDSTAIGPRDAARGLLLVSGDAAGSGLQADLVRAGLVLPDGARLVLVHALAAMGDPAWLGVMLGDVAAEDLARAKSITLLALGALPAVLESGFSRPNISVTIATLPLGYPAASDAQIRATLASL